MPPNSQNDAPLRLMTRFGTPRLLGSFQVDGLHWHPFHWLNGASVYGKPGVPHPSDDFISEVSERHHIKLTPIVNRTCSFPGSNYQLPLWPQNTMPLPKCCGNLLGVDMVNGEEAQDSC